MNAKDEFINHTGIRSSVVKCAELYQDYNYGESAIYYRLKIGYTEEEYQTFLNSINFRYDSGYGGQELFGIIWYEDGTWSNRGEYDGSEWWVYNSCPKIPNELIS